MLDNKYLKNFEKLLVEESTKQINRELLKHHYTAILKMANPIIKDKKIILNENQFILMMHLFNLCNQIEYIPSL